MTDIMQRTHDDLQEATEHGACGIAILVVQKRQRLVVVRRARKGTGFDYWLGNKKQLFQETARLEVSGILSGDETDMRARLKLKHRQTTRSDTTLLPSVVVVVDFARPMVGIEERRAK